MSDLRGTRVLLTGASGFLGGATVGELLAGGADLHLLVRPGADLGALGSLLERVHRHEADLCRYTAVQRAVRTVAPDVILHLASAGVRQPFLPVQVALRDNVGGAVNLLRATDGRVRLLVARTPGELTAMNPYSASKAAAWEFAKMFVRTRGLPLLGLMPFHVYGPGQPPGQLVPSAARAALAGEDFPMTHGQQLRDWVYVEDVARAFRLAAAQGRFEGDTAEIGTGVATTLLEVVQLIYAIAGRGGHPRPGAVPTRPGEVDRLVADPTTAERLVAWRSTTPLEDGLRRTIGLFSTKD